MAIMCLSFHTSDGFLMVFNENIKESGENHRLAAGQ
jgi:hypothetical protein